MYLKVFYIPLHLTFNIFVVRELAYFLKENIHYFLAKASSSVCTFLKHVSQAVISFKLGTLSYSSFHFFLFLAPTPMSR